MNLLAFNREEKKVLSFVLFKESCLEGRYPILMKNFNQLNGTFYQKENVIFIETPAYIIVISCNYLKLYMCIY